MPTAAIAAKIRSLQAELIANDPHGETLQVFKARHERRFGLLKQIVTGFVIAQLEAEPAIDAVQLRGQLVRILGDRRGSANQGPSTGAPYVLQTFSMSGQSSSVWAVAYGGDAYNGIGGARTVVESYVVENGKARLAGRGGSEMDGAEFNAEQIPNPQPNSTSVLTHGIIKWSSGHELPSAAALYTVSPAGVKLTWKLAAPGIRFIGRDETLFVIAYHDQERFSKNQPSTVVDAYALDANTGVPYRVIHQFPAFR